MRWSSPAIPLLVAWTVVSSSPVPAEPAAGFGWLRAETRHFSILSQADPRRTREIAVGLERFRAALARLAPALELRSPAPTTILAFRDADAYAPYKNGRESGGRILGQFLSHADGNYLTLDAGELRAGALAVIYHEYVHDFVRHNFPGVPRWFNEGLAEYYSTFAIEDGKAIVGRPISRHLAWLRRNGDFDLGGVLEWTAGGGHSAAVADGAYPLSWALVHYLLSGDGERLEQTADFFLRLDGGEPPRKALEEAFGRRLAELEEDLATYVATASFASTPAHLGRLDEVGVRLDEVRPAEAHYHLGDLAGHLGRRQLAADHFYAAMADDPSHGDAAAGLAWLRDLAESSEEAAVLWADAAALRPQRALSHLHHGRHLLRHAAAGGRDEVVAQARDAFAEAVAIDPAFAEAQAMLGTVHLFSGLDARDGLEPIRRARAALPERDDLVVRQVQLLLQAGEIDAAEHLVETVLAPSIAAETTDRLRAEVQRARLLGSARRALAAGDDDEGLRLFDEAVSATPSGPVREAMERELRALQQRVGG